MNEFFDGHVISVSEGTLRIEDLIEGVMSTIEYIHDEGTIYTGLRQDVADLIDLDDMDELELVYAEVTEDLEELANRNGYTFGTLEGDGAHFVLAPLTQDRLYG